MERDAAIAGADAVICCTAATTPILDADRARTVMVIKRSMSPGFAGIDNELYYMNNTLMLFGDAKNFVAGIVKELAGSH